MQELWSGASYEPHLLSLLFALAPAAMLTVIAYTAVMRGAPVLRGWLLAHMLSLLPYATVMMMSPSIVSREVAEHLFRAAASLVPLAAACGTGFQLALIRRYGEHRRLVWFLVANAVVWIAVGNAGELAVSDVEWLGSFWFPVTGSLAWLGVANTTAIAAVGFVALGRVALRGRSSVERRQLRAAWLANLITYAGLLDVALAYGFGVFPLGWLLSGTGCLLVVRALVVEDLLRVRAIDTSLPLLVVHFAAGVTIAWLALAQVGPHPGWWVVALVLAVSFAGVRAVLAMVSLIVRGARGGEGPLERLLAQLVARARALTEAVSIAQLAADIVHLGVGVTPAVLLAAEEDWGWMDRDGARLADDAAPDPLLIGWLAEHRAPVFADDLDEVPADLRELAVQLFERQGARALLPVHSADEVIALILVPSQARRIRGGHLAFVRRVADRLAEALLHARLARHAAERAVLAREVELARAVQTELLPGRGPHVHGGVTVVGSWRPATRCAGDFWGVYPLSGGRVLIAIGDVTGHGVASAMVTAAALGACDVYVRRSGERLDLAELMAALDVAVRRVGGGELAMTCFAAVLDPAGRDLAYASCGHTAPYLCRAAVGPVVGAVAASGSAQPVGGPETAGGSGTAGEGGGAVRGIDLSALVGRGNPLGAGMPSAPRVVHRTLEPGDLVVCYTDGVIEAQDPAGRPFGDRRLQHLLKRLERQRLAPASVHELVEASVSAHRAGRPLADDETVVVAQVAQAAQEAVP